MIRQAVNVILAICVLVVGWEGHGDPYRPAIIFIKLFEAAVLHCIATEPNAAAILLTATTGKNVLVPLCLHSVVISKVLFADAKENVVIHPLGYGADAFPMEDVCTCICELTVNATSRCETKIVAGVDSKLIFAS